MKYTLKNRHALRLLRNGDKIELLTSTRQTTLIVRTNFFSKDSVNVQNTLRSMFGAAYNNMLVANDIISGLIGPKYETYYDATVIAHLLFDLCQPNSPAFDLSKILTDRLLSDTVTVEISGIALNQVYYYACEDWKVKLKEHIKDHDFDPQSGYSVGCDITTKELGGCKLVDAGIVTSDKWNVLLIQNNKVVKTIKAKNINDIHISEIETSNKVFHEIVRFSVKRTLLEEGYRRAGSNVKLILQLKMTLIEDSRFYKIGDTAGKYTIVGVGDDKVGLLNLHNITNVVSQDPKIQFNLSIFGAVDDLKPSFF